MIETRWLQGDDLKQIEPLIRAHGWVPLNPTMSRALVAYEGETIVGAAAFTCIPHVSFLWVATSHRGTGMAKQLTDGIVEFLYEVNAPEAYIVACTPHTEKLAIQNGMELVRYPVYYKRGR